MRKSPQYAIVNREPMIGAALLAAAVVAASGCAGDNPGDSFNENSQLVVHLADGAQTWLSMNDLAALPQARVPADDLPCNSAYEGVWLADVLEAVGVVLPEPNFAAVASGTGASPDPLEVVVEGADGYRATFAAEQVAHRSTGKGLLLANRKDGAALGSDGPYQIVQPAARDQHHWVKQVVRVIVRRPEPRGSVYLVGIGPGHPALVTAKAVELIRRADRVFCFDYLKEEVARWVPDADALEAVPFADFRSGGPQERHRLAARVRRHVVLENETVVFCAAGDPMIFCPWSWLVDELTDLEPTVVPGVSSFNAGLAALRQNAFHLSGSVVLTDGRDLGMPDQNGRMHRTMVFFTHALGLEELVPKLLALYAPDTPVQIVADASDSVQERFISGTLETIIEEAGRAGLPHLYIVFAGDSLATDHTHHHHTHDHDHDHPHHHPHTHPHTNGHHHEHHHGHDH